LCGGVLYAWFLFIRPASALRGAALFNLKFIYYCLFLGAARRAAAPRARGGGGGGHRGAARGARVEEARGALLSPARHPRLEWVRRPLLVRAPASVHRTRRALEAVMELGVAISEPDDPVISRELFTGISRFKLRCTPRLVFPVWEGSASHCHLLSWSSASFVISSWSSASCFISAWR
jgi:hypothetical protein